MRVRSPKEISIQTQIVKWFEMQYPQEVIIYNENERRRTPAQGALWKAAGGKAGVPDLWIPCPKRRYSGLYIELKRPERIEEKNGGLSDAQIRMIAHLRSRNYCCIVAYGFEDAIDCIKGYMG